MILARLARLARLGRLATRAIPPPNVLALTAAQKLGAGRQCVPPFTHTLLARFGRLRLLARPPTTAGKLSLIEKAFSGPRPAALLGLALLAPARAFAEPAAQEVMRRPDLLQEVDCLRRCQSESRRLALEQEKDVQQAQQQIARLVAELCAARVHIKRIQATAEEVKLDLERDLLCVVCMDGPRAITYGCSHHVTCQACDAELQRRPEIDKCPTCRAPITQRVAHIT